MKKSILLSLLAIIVLSLCGCNDNDDNVDGKWEYMSYLYISYENLEGIEDNTTMHIKRNVNITYTDKTYEDVFDIDLETNIGYDRDLPTLSDFILHTGRIRDNIIYTYYITSDIDSWANRTDTVEITYNTNFTPIKLVYNGKEIENKGHKGDNDVYFRVTE